jgi:hypothetical protein
MAFNSGHELLGSGQDASLCWAGALPNSLSPMGADGDVTGPAIKVGTV